MVLIKHLAEGIEASVGSIAKIDQLTCKKLDVDVEGFKTKGKGASQQDIEIEVHGKGIVLRSPNGHRWRIVISDAGVISGVDLDA